MTQDYSMLPNNLACPSQSDGVSVLPTPPMNEDDMHEDHETKASDLNRKLSSPIDVKVATDNCNPPTNGEAETIDSSASDSDESESEGDTEFKSFNSYFKLLNSKPETDRPSNWRSVVLFSGRLAPTDLPDDCPRPQLSNGALTPELHSLVENLLLPDGSLKRHDPSIFNMSTLASTTLSNPTLRQEEARGYVLNNGLTWVRHKSTATEKETEHSSAPQAKKRKSTNLSLIIAGSKRIYNNSNECIAFAQGGECSAGVLCIYDHDGKSEHQKISLCKRQMMGLCRNGSNCKSGYHKLASHQLPVCDYYLRIMCSSENCEYLHIKHQDSIENCPAFQKGICKLGLKCFKPHRYNSTRIQQKSSGSSSMATMSETSDQPPESQLANWHF